MATQALIKINNVVGSNTTLPLNTLVSLANSGAGGETTWEWTLVSQPAGTTVTLSTPTASTSSFTPTKEGSYLIQLVVNKGLGDEKTNTVIAAVRELQTGSRIPAAGETLEVSSSTGWSNTAVSEILQRVTRMTDAGVLVGRAAGSLTAGDVVYISDIAPIASGLPGERQAPTFSKAHANIVAETHGVIGVFSRTVAGAASAVANDMIRVITLGPWVGVTMAAGGAVGDNVYVSDTGTLSLTAGTHTRQVGTVASVAGTLYDVFISGIAESGGGSAAGPAGGVLGYPGSTYPNPNGLSANVIDQIPLAPYAGSNSIVMRADDQSTMAGTSVSLVGGDATAGVDNGGDVQLSAGTSVGGIGGGVRLYSASGASGGSITIQAQSGTASSGGAVSITGGTGATNGGDVQIVAGQGPSGGNLSLASGQSTAGTGSSFIAAAGQGTGTGGSSTLRGGAANSGTGTGGAAFVTGGAGGSTGTGGAAQMNGGAVTAAVGGNITVDGGLTSPLAKTGGVTIKSQNAQAAGSTGAIAISTGNGGTAGTPGRIDLTAGNSTQNTTLATGGGIGIQAGSNTTASGVGGSVILQAGSGGTSGTATGGLLQLVGGKASVSEGAVVLAGGAASTTSTTGGAVTLTSGIGASNTVGPGAVSINVGTNGGTATADINIGTSGSLGTVYLGTTSNAVVRIGAQGKNTTYLGVNVTPPYTQALTADTNTVSVLQGITRVTAAITNINLISTPTVTTTNIAAGTRVLIFNAGSNSVSFNDTNHVAGTLLLLGANTRILTAGGTLELVYLPDSTNTFYWYEISFRG